MRVILFILAVLAAFAGAAIFSAAKSAIHEIEAFMLFLIAATMFSAAIVVDALVGVRNAVKDAQSKVGEVGGAVITQMTAIKKQLVQTEVAQHQLPPVPGSEEFFVAVDSRVEGPVTRKQLGELKIRGAIGDGSPVIARGTKEWVQARSILNGA